MSGESDAEKQGSLLGKTAKYVRLPFQFAGPQWPVVRDQETCQVHSGRCVLGETDPKDLSRKKKLKGNM